MGNSESTILGPPLPVDEENKLSSSTKNETGQHNHDAPATCHVANDSPTDSSFVDDNGYGNYISSSDYGARGSTHNDDDAREMNDPSLMGSDDQQDDHDDDDSDDIFCVPGARSRGESMRFTPFKSCTTLVRYDEDEDGEDEEQEKYNGGRMFGSDGDLLDNTHTKRKTTRKGLKIGGNITLLNAIPFLPDINYTEEEILMEDGDIPTPESDLRPVRNSNNSVTCRSFHVVTTATLPWMTGTAVNPLLRAVYLNKMNRTAVEEISSFNNDNLSHQVKYDMMGTVTLCVPWLVDETDRKTVYGEQYNFESCHDQEKYIRMWLRESAKLPLEADLDTNGIQIAFYKATYSLEFLSILPLGDVRECINLNEEKADICILEEPEHLNFTLPLHCKPWTQSFRHVVGIMHTNYAAYTKAHLSSLVMTPFIFNISNALTRVHCDKIIKLSDTLQTYAIEKECVTNVHGIRKDFLDEGQRRAMSLKTGCDDIDTSEGIYFIGKLLWAKGLDKLLELESAYKRKVGDYFKIDVYGSGPEEEEIRRAFHGWNKRSFSSKENLKKASSVKDKMDALISEMPKSRFEFRKESIPASFPGRKDHALLTDGYKIFVNPSITEVLCTTTAEAIAMGKFAIIPVHPSNTFFEQFPNCLTYQRKSDFVSKLQYAIAHDPTPLSDEHFNILTWEAANERCVQASMITKRDQQRRKRLGQVKIDNRAMESLKGAVLQQALQRYLLSSKGMVETSLSVEDRSSSVKNEPSIENE